MSSTQSLPRKGIALSGQKEYALVRRYDKEWSHLGDILSDPRHGPVSGAAGDRDFRCGLLFDLECSIDLLLLQLFELEQDFPEVSFDDQLFHAKLFGRLFDEDLALARGVEIKGVDVKRGLPEARTRWRPCPSGNGCENTRCPPSSAWQLKRTPPARRARLDHRQSARVRCCTTPLASARR